MNVGEAVGHALAQLGVRQAFGVVGSGNYHVTNGLLDGGVKFVAARHEGGAATMADAYARVSGEVAVVSLHPGCGLTNAVTGIGEAAKSRTPMIVITGDASDTASNFFIDQDALAASVGATNVRLRSPQTAIVDARRAYATALRERRTVVFHLPMDVQETEFPAERFDTAPAAHTQRSASGSAARFDTAPAAPTQRAGNSRSLRSAEPSQRSLSSAKRVSKGQPQFTGLTPVEPIPAPRAADEAVQDLADALRAAKRPVFIAGRGARGVAARDALVALADQTGALLSEGAVAKGLFAGNPWSIDVAGGFSSPLTVELIGAADLVVGWGTALNQWTTRHGQMIAPETKIVQVDIEPAGIERQRPVDLAVLGDVAATAAATTELLRATDGASEPEPDRASTEVSSPAQDGDFGYRSEALKARIAAEVKWRGLPYEDESTADRIDPRTLSITLDDLLPRERTLSIDSGNFMGYPSMYLDVPDENAYVMTQAFQAIGLGLSTAIGAALARPDRLPVLASGDGGFLMSIAELETLGRLEIPMLIVIYNDHAYGAEVYHFTPDSEPRETVVFPDTDIAAIARGYGYDGVMVRTTADLGAVAELVAQGLRKPLIVDAKVTGGASWWLAMALKH
ncbi:thiamine pyrophosphate-binding protein [Gulosibacter chungangensis]|uniref:Thiamine pyrophosphate-binding protein n=1 Tax=Gulosibacter chungangensis TaxID=979746 RepID=A0A7J5BFH0_9MICO|nr:thiamine pyrophosphate-binding protein [Gulosibacter chungangensis]KAB1645017.1 thiamine pyrophosphate-binding protein [Gulosibacter chungangensis]